MFFELLSYSMIGIVSGFAAGLLGIGGGIIVVPSLFFFMNYYKVEQEHLMQIVIATSLASMIFSTISSLIAHQKRKGINWRIANEMLIGLCVGCLLGAYIAKLLSNTALTIIFGIFLIGTGVQIFISKERHLERSIEVKKPRFWICSGLGFFISFVATLLGIGGGLFTVPILNSFRIQIKRAIATSSAVTFFITVLGSISYFLIGLRENFDNTASVGFIYFPAFIAISLFSLFFAPVGVVVMHHIRTIAIKRIFGITLLMIGVYMIIKGFW